MRKILFRGKLTERFADAVGIRPDLVTQGVIKDNFVYGTLVIDNNKCFICTSVNVSNMSYVNNVNGTMFEVDPETVGQFTGIVDKNGKKVFEGDIFKFSDEIWESSYTSCGTEWDSWKVEIYAVVGFDDERSGFDFVKYKFCGNSVEADFHENHDIEFAEFISSLEVIGNIYDNPELIGG